MVSKPDEERVGSTLGDTPDFSFVYLLPSNFKLELFKQTLIEISLGHKANLKWKLCKNLWWSHSSPFLQLENRSRPCLSSCL